MGCNHCKIIVCLFFMVSTSCSFDVGGIEKVSKISDNFYVLVTKGNNNDGYSISYTDDNESYEILETNCDSIFYDSISVCFKRKEFGGDAVFFYSIGLLPGDMSLYRKLKKITRKEFERQSSGMNYLDLDYK